MRNPITSTWRTLRRVLHPFEMLGIAGVGTIFCGLWLWLPAATALITIGGMTVAISIIALVAAASQGN